MSMDNMDKPGSPDGTTPSMSTLEYEGQERLTFVPRRPRRLTLCAPALGPAAVHRAVAAGAVVVDGRSPEAHDSCHIAGSVSIPIDGGAFADRARAVTHAGSPIVAAAEGDIDGHAVARALTGAGFRTVVGVVAGGIPAYDAAGYDVRCQPAAAADRLLEALELGGAVLVDARDDAEWRQGHVPGSVHMPLRSLRGAARHLPRTPVVVACSDGRRAATAASILRRGGHENVWRATGAGLPFLLSRRLDLRGV
jgi:hydroxyacylglutathione hydrolase